MNIVIVDDEKSCVKALADKLNEYDDTNLVGVAYNGMDGLKLMSEQNLDLMFLDIELPDISGIEFLERIESISDGRCRVVMYTAHGRYMLPAFRNKAFDYLMKPIDDAELRQYCAELVSTDVLMCHNRHQLKCRTIQTRRSRHSTVTVLQSATTENSLYIPIL